jgi:hypothetical protein
MMGSAGHFVCQVTHVVYTSLRQTTCCIYYFAGLTFIVDQITTKASLGEMRHRSTLQTRTQAQLRSSATCMRLSPRGKLESIMLW